MDPRFSDEEWAKLSIDERLRLCNSMALDLRKLADTAREPDEGYLRIAEKWEALAAEIAAAHREGALRT